MALVTYTPGATYATVAMDDGKANALSPAMLAELDAALTRAEDAGTAVVLTGRAGVFCAGFDLGVLRSGGGAARDMFHAGFLLAERLLLFPRPVVAACSGHAVAMGALLLLACDYRVGATGPFRITTNEVAIGLTMPWTAIELCRHRLTPAQFERAVALAEVLSPQDAVTGGFLDRAVDPAELTETAQGIAEQLAALDAAAHAATKQRIRASTMAALRTAIQDDYADLAALEALGAQQ